MSMKKEQALITDVDGTLYKPGEMLRILMKRNGVSRKDLHSYLDQKGVYLASPSQISDFCSNKHERSIPDRYIEALISSLGMSKDLTKYFTCEYIKCKLDKSLHQYVEAKQRIVKLKVQEAELEEYRKSSVIREIKVSDLEEELLKEKELSQGYGRELDEAYSEITDLKERVLGLELKDLGFTESDISEYRAENKAKDIAELKEIVSMLRETLIEHSDVPFDDTPTDEEIACYELNAKQGFFDVFMERLYPVVRQPDFKIRPKALFKNDTFTRDFFKNAFIQSKVLSGEVYRYFSIKEIEDNKLMRSIEAVFTSFWSEGREDSIDTIIREPFLFEEACELFFEELGKLGEFYSPLSDANILSPLPFNRKQVTDNANYLHNRLVKSYDRYVANGLNEVCNFETFMLVSEPIIDDKFIRLLAINSYINERTLSCKIAEITKENNLYSVSYADTLTSPYSHFDRIQFKGDTESLGQSVVRLLGDQSLSSSNIRACISKRLDEVSAIPTLNMGEKEMTELVDKCNKGDPAAIAVAERKLNHEGLRYI